jgi:hypothetical protein
MTDFFVLNNPTAGANTDGGASRAAVNKQGNMVIMDFFMHMALMGKAYQVRAGTITTPLVGDVLITDTAAEFSVDATAGYMIIPVYQNISIRLGAGTLHEYATKSVNVVSSAGTAFVPLPLRNIGTASATAVAAATTARVSAAGGVTVTAELATTTRRHWSHSNPVAVGAGNDNTTLEWNPRMPPVLSGPVCLYTQIAATTTGPSYYASLDYIENISSALV